MTIIYGRIVEAKGIKHGYVDFEDGIIKNVQYGSEIPAKARVFNDDCLIFPGFIDLNAICINDNENYITAGAAALNGGVIFLCDKSQTLIRDDNDYYKRMLLSRSCPIDVLIYADITDNSNPLLLSIPYFINDDVNFKNIEKIFRRYRKSIQLNHNILVLVGYEQIIQFLYSTLDAADKYSIKLRIDNVNDFGTLRSLHDKSISCSTSPEYLYFNQDMCELYQWLAYSKPDYSHISSQMTILDNIDYVDYMISNHYPCTFEEKMKGCRGLPSLDIYGAIISWLINIKSVDPCQIFKLACKKPGEWVNKFLPSKRIGRLINGYEASIAVINTKSPMVNARGLFTKCQWSPCDLRLLPGNVETVYYKGEKVVDGDWLQFLN